ncbi:hypothetical protein [Mycobacteroides saopaulense]|uniref:Uncharacterized protein n=1 Tax=Mycobacteroides saopaulense TaxID=1578165 RepID=A0A1S1JU17_9MYCO|nr:hypothetical protein [Mycobacteroides saopaulense]ALR14204.1 hypothetical protein MYCSP_13605 [Mycobacteroides saopaulense]OHT88284.1 hypothetical protein BKG68_08565 [Mycobacteroides saopaulense]OHU06626.1 hypothetical protein BKG73_22710 [Mycobacteroides saopaulense]ORB51677.1 hypothetical protein BST43_20275 [Mycobacteroides saopaulense]
MSNEGSPPPPGTGPVADRRQEFEELSRRHREGANERAYIEHKIEIVTSDPHLSAEEKAAAIAELRRALE